MGKRISACGKSPGHQVVFTVPKKTKKKKSSKNRDIYCSFKNQLIHPVWVIIKCCMFIAGRDVFSGLDAPVSQLSLCASCSFFISYTSTVAFGHATLHTGGGKKSWERDNSVKYWCKTWRISERESKRICQWLSKVPGEEHGSANSHCSSGENAADVRARAHTHAHTQARTQN